jgi:hypothetical protein
LADSSGAGVGARVRLGRDAYSCRPVLRARRKQEQHARALRTRRSDSRWSTSHEGRRARATRCCLVCSPWRRSRTAIRQWQWLSPKCMQPGTTRIARSSGLIQRVDVRRASRKADYRLGRCARLCNTRRSSNHCMRIRVGASCWQRLRTSQRYMKGSANFGSASNAVSVKICKKLSSACLSSSLRLRRRGVRDGLSRSRMLSHSLCCTPES